MPTRHHEPRGLARELPSELRLAATNGSTVLFSADSSGVSGGQPPAEGFSFVLTNSGTFFVEVRRGPLYVTTSSTYQLLVVREHPLLISPQIVGADMRLSFPTVPAKNYQVQTSSNLLFWTVLSSPIPGTGGTITFTDTGGTAGAARFYRVAVLP